jgi:hypothetical protein
MYKKINLIFFLLAIVFAYSTQAQPPYLDKSESALKLKADSKLFIFLGGGLHKSTGSDKEVMTKVSIGLKALNLNNVFTCAY